MEARENSLNLANEKGYKTQNGQITDLAFYKKEVNLVAFAEYLGYKVNYNKTGRNIAYNYRFVRMDYPDTSSPEDRIIVYKNKSEDFTFKSVDGEDINSSGSAIDLVQRRRNCSFGDSLRILDKFILEHGFGSSSLQLNPIEIPIGDLDREIKSFNNIVPLKEESLKYLTEERKISPETLNSPLFKNQIYSSIRKTSHDSNPTYNIAFPLRGLASLEYYVQLENNSFAQSFDVRNKNFKSKEEVSHGAFWRSNFDSQKKLDAVYVGESPIDCLAHYELNKESLQNKNIMYMATAGTIQSAQLQILQIPFSKSQTEKSLIMSDKLVSIFDNDISGAKYTAQVIAAFSPETFEKNHGGVLENNTVNIYPSVKPKNNTINILFVKDGNSSENDVFANRLFKAIEKLNANIPLATSTDAKRFNYSIVENNNKKMFINVSFHNSSNNAQIFNDFMINEKFGKSKKFVQDLPILKDFNDDLKAIKGTNKDTKELYINKFEKKKRYEGLSDKILTGKYRVDFSPVKNNLKL